MIYTDVTSRALTYLLKRPGLHIDMTESIYRGLAEIRYAEPDGVLQLVHAHSTGAPVLYQLSADTREAAEKLLPLITLKIPVVAHQACCVEAVTARRDQLVSSCIQALWPTFAPPPANPAVEIWPLDLGDLRWWNSTMTSRKPNPNCGADYLRRYVRRLCGGPAGRFYRGTHGGSYGDADRSGGVSGAGNWQRAAHIFGSPGAAPGPCPLQSDFSGEPGVYGAAEKSGDGASAGNHLVAAAEAVNGGMAQLQREQMRKLRDKSWKKNGQKAGDGVLFI